MGLPVFWYSSEPVFLIVGLTKDQTYKFLLDLKVVSYLLDANTHHKGELAEW